MRTVTFTFPIKTQDLSRRLKKSNEADLKVEEPYPAEIESEGRKIISGIATTTALGPDNVIITKEALEEALNRYPHERPVLLFNHNPDKIIGKVLSAEVVDLGQNPDGFPETVYGLYVTAQISNTDEGKEKWQLIKDGSLSQMSIRAKVEEKHPEFFAPIQKEVNVATKINILETSLVSVPALSTARIMSFGIQRSWEGTDDQDNQKQNVMSPDESYAELLHAAECVIYALETLDKEPRAGYNFTQEYNKDKI